MSVLAIWGGTVSLLNKLADGIRAAVKAKRKHDASEKYNSIVDSARNGVCDTKSDRESGADPQ